MAHIHRCTGRRLLAGAVLVLASSAALADSFTLDFDDLGYSFLGAGDSFEHKGLSFTAQGGPGVDPGSLVGALFDGNDPSMCQRLYCPVNNFTPGYYAGLNDGMLAISSSAGSGSLPPTRPAPPCPAST